MLKTRGMNNHVQVGLHVQKSTLVYIIDNDFRVVGHYAVYISKVVSEKFLAPIFSVIQDQ